MRESKVMIKEGKDSGKKYKTGEHHCRKHQLK
jgi:hypothetical protein